MLGADGVAVIDSPSEKEPAGIERRSPVAESGGADPAASWESTGGRFYDIKADSDRCKLA
ncbi:hypothetical protein MALGJ_11480 [Mycolicibacter algericus]|uniref:Uncharacterized protein n=1 Tax=Mycolicibacter algericus TaxID=1288388 RepID=A0A7I9Y767_MYCAL|nr:hypothetical protein MALGJ_11480 [Mycolicibacter algericus]